MNVTEEVGMIPELESAGLLELIESCERITERSLREDGPFWQTWYENRTWMRPAFVSLVVANVVVKVLYKKWGRHLGGPVLGGWNFGAFLDRVNVFLWLRYAKLRTGLQRLRNKFMMGRDKNNRVARGNQAQVTAAADSEGINSSSGETLMNLMMAAMGEWSKLEIMKAGDENDNDEIVKDDVAARDELLKILKAKLKTLEEEMEGAYEAGRSSGEADGTAGETEESNLGDGLLLSSESIVKIEPADFEPTQENDELYENVNNLPEEATAAASAAAGKETPGESSSLSDIGYKITRELPSPDSFIQTDTSMEDCSYYESDFEQLTSSGRKKPKRNVTFAKDMEQVKYYMPDDSPKKMILRLTEQRKLSLEGLASAEEKRNATKKRSARKTKRCTSSAASEDEDKQGKSLGGSFQSARGGRRSSGSRKAKV